jgi:hypothetical protein
MSSSPWGKRIEVLFVIHYLGGVGADGRYVEDTSGKLFVPGVKNTELYRGIFRVARESWRIHEEY